MQSEGQGLPDPASRLCRKFSQVLINAQTAQVRTVLRTDLSKAGFSSNLARKKWRLEGNMETGETVAEETETPKLLMLQDFPITLKDFS